MAKQYVFTARDAFRSLPIISAAIEVLYVLYIRRDYLYLGYNAVTGDRYHVEMTPLPLFFDNARRLNAQKLILAHTHPDGALHPSIGDMTFTREIGDIAGRQGLRLIDHLIVTWPYFYSMRGHGHFSRSLKEATRI